MEMFLENLIRFAKISGKLKTVKRSGWISHAKIVEPESVADHSFRCGILAMCIGDLMGMPVEKLMKMMLLHDIHEAITGDYNTSAKQQGGISELEHQQKIAIQEILSLFSSKLEKQYISLWEEFEKRETPEAILANDIDKIEMMFQALEYEKEGYDPEKFETFWIDMRDRLKTPLIRDLFMILQNERMTSEIGRNL